MQLPGSGNIPFAMRVPAAPAALRNRLDRAALAQLDSLILTIGNFRSLAPERRAQRQRKGIVTLFCGGRGTGKTTAAQLLALETGKDLYIVDPGRVIGRYAGETEKHLDALLTAAQANDVILFFEGADALFGRRHGAGDHGDRYPKVQINYLLGRLEAHAGLTIFACDLRESIDPVAVFSVSTRASRN